MAEYLPDYFPSARIPSAENIEVRLPNVISMEKISVDPRADSEGPHLTSDANGLVLSTDTILHRS